MRISNIKKTFPVNNFNLAIDEINLQMNKINCLIGDNGSGKSTLLKQIILDECNHNIDSKYLMLQKPYIFTKTVQYNLELVKTLAISDIDVDCILSELNLDTLKNTQTSSLSGGQRQRLAFAMALISNYDLIMLDEPFNNIDLKSQKIMINLMKKTNKTFLIVVHNTNLARTIGDYFFFIEAGKIVYNGNKNDFFCKDNYYIKEYGEME